MRRRLGSRLAVLVAALGLTAGIAGATAPAYGDEGGAVIDHAQLSHGAVKLLVSVPGTAAVDLGSVQVTIGGTQVDATAEDASRSNDVRRTTVLAIDTSNSMKGKRIAEAKRAALAYLDAVPANVAVGVVSFDDSVRTLLAPGTDRAAARTAIAGLTLAQNTVLYDGLTAAVKAAGSSGQREVLLLSDGKDTTGKKLGDVLGTIRGAGVKVDVVSLQQSDADSLPLNQIAAAGKGTMLSAGDPSALTAAYAREARVLARQVLVTATVPADQSATSADVAVTLGAGDRSFTGSAYVAVTAASDRIAPTAHEAERITALAIPQAAVWGAIGAIGLGLLGIFAVLVLGGSTKPPTLEEQIDTYGAAGTGAQPRGGATTKAATASLADQAREMAAKALANNRTLEARIAHLLEAAGLALKPAEWVLIHGGIAIGAAVLGGLLTGGNPVLTLAFLLFGLIGPWGYLVLTRSRRVRAFNHSLADTLQLMSGSLSAGLSLAQSIDTVVREGNEPISSEFRRVIVEARLGVPMEDALEGVADRMESKDFAWVVMAIRIQRQVGGNLSELLTTVAATLREREYLRRHVRALSAEGRLSCWILGGLPPAFMGYVVLTKPDYMHPMFSTAIGIMMCVAMAVLLAVGIFWMSKVAKVEV
jgi:tight adherence protein B